MFKFRKKKTLIFTPENSMTVGGVHDALIFLFSQKGASDLAFAVARTRRHLPREARERLNELAGILEVPKIAPPLLSKLTNIPYDEKTYRTERQTRE